MLDASQFYLIHVAHRHPRNSSTGFSAASHLAFHTRRYFSVIRRGIFPTRLWRVARGLYVIFADKETAVAPRRRLHLRPTEVDRDKISSSCPLD